jgi:putative ATPase
MPTAKRTAPLAEHLRPDRLDNFIGQRHILTYIRSLCQTEQPTNLLFFGPPGCGKSTLALVIANAFNRPYLRVSAPEIGLPALRKQLADIEILILDELHRFSKA